MYVVLWGYITRGAGGMFLQGKFEVLAYIRWYTVYWESFAG